MFVAEKVLLLLVISLTVYGLSIKDTHKNPPQFLQLVLIDMHTIKVPLNVLFVQARVTPPCIRPWLSLWSSVTLWRRGILHLFTKLNNKLSTIKRLANHNFTHPLSICNILLLTDTMVNVDSLCPVTGRLHGMIDKGPFQYKDYRSRYAYCQHKEKTVMRSSYRYNVNLYSGETAY